MLPYFRFSVLDARKQPCYTSSIHVPDHETRSNNPPADPRHHPDARGSSDETADNPRLCGVRARQVEQGGVMHKPMTLKRCRRIAQRIAGDLPLPVKMYIVGVTNRASEEMQRQIAVERLRQAEIDLFDQGYKLVDMRELL